MIGAGFTNVAGKEGSFSYGWIESRVVCREGGLTRRVVFACTGPMTRNSKGNKAS